MTTSTVFNSREHEAYVWQVHGKPLSIHVNLNVIERLQLELFQSGQPGHEAVGVLLGRVHESGFLTTFTVDGYELIRENGSALNRQKQLAEIVSKWSALGGDRRAIGLVRSQPRGWLALGEEDLETARNLFPQYDNIFLVVRSSAGSEPRAGFFFWEGRQIRANESYSEFVFDSEVLRRQLTSRVRVVNAEAEVLSEETPRSPFSFARSIRNSPLAIGATWCLALAITLTCVHALEPDANAGTGGRLCGLLRT